MAVPSLPRALSVYAHPLGELIQAYHFKMSPIIRLQPHLYFQPGLVSDLQVCISSSPFVISTKMLSKHPKCDMPGTDLLISFFSQNPVFSKSACVYPQNWGHVQPLLTTPTVTPAGIISTLDKAEASQPGFLLLPLARLHSVDHITTCDLLKMEASSCHSSAQTYQGLFPSFSVKVEDPTKYDPRHSSFPVPCFTLLWLDAQVHVDLPCYSLPLPGTVPSLDLCTCYPF